MSENNDYIQLPPLKKDTPADVVAFMWEKFIKLDKLIFLLLAQLYTQFSASIFQCRQIIRHVLFSFFYLYLLFLYILQGCFMCFYDFICYL